jgi:hypothetical protein
MTPLRALVEALIGAERRASVSWPQEGCSCLLVRDSPLDSQKPSHSRTGHMWWWRRFVCWCVCVWVPRRRAPPSPLLPQETDLIAWFSGSNSKSLVDQGRHVAQGAGVLWCASAGVPGKVSRPWLALAQLLACLPRILYCPGACAVSSYGVSVQPSDRGIRKNTVGTPGMSSRGGAQPCRLLATASGAARGGAAPVGPVLGNGKTR